MPNQLIKPSAARWRRMQKRCLLGVGILFCLALGFAMLWKTAPSATFRYRMKMLVATELLSIHIFAADRIAQEAFTEGHAFSLPFIRRILESDNTDKKVGALHSLGMILDDGVDGRRNANFDKLAMIEALEASIAKAMFDDDESVQRAALGAIAGCRLATEKMKSSVRRRATTGGLEVRFTAARNLFLSGYNGEEVQAAFAEVLEGTNAMLRRRTLDMISLMTTNDVRYQHALAVVCKNGDTASRFKAAKLLLEIEPSRSEALETLIELASSPAVTESVDARRLLVISVRRDVRAKEYLQQKLLQLSGPRAGRLERILAESQR